MIRKQKYEKELQPLVIFTIRSKLATYNFLLVKYAFLLVLKFLLFASLSLSIFFTWSFNKRVLYKLTCVEMAKDKSVFFFKRKLPARNWKIIDLYFLRRALISFSCVPNGWIGSTKRLFKYWLPRPSENLAVGLFSFSLLRKIWSCYSEIENPLLMSSAIVSLNDYWL